MIRAMTAVATVLGGLLGIAQTGYWFEQFCDVFVDYWTRRR